MEIKMKKNIDQQFQEALGTLEHTPEGMQRNPERLWSGIESSLNQHRRKRQVAIWWSAAAASVAIAIAVGWALVPTQDQQPGKEAATLATADSLQLKPERQYAPAVSDTMRFAAPQFDAPTQQTENLESGTKSDWMAVNNYRTRGQKWNAKPSPDANGQVTITSTLSNEGSVSLNKNQAHGYTYTWTSKADGNALAGAGTTSADGKMDFSKINRQTGSNDGDLGLATGIYTLSVTDGNGCVAGGKSGFFKQKLASVAGKKGYVDQSVLTDPYGSESYAETVENDYFRAIQEPLSTFSIDVDRASYTNHRRFIEGGQLPPKYSVRAEEFINYFHYDYEPPHNGDPFSILPEVASCPWNPSHKLVRIALKGREVPRSQIPPSNLVFLLDVSGSMDSEDKLGLLKKAMVLLTNELREQDRVSIVVYAGAAGLVLPPTSGIYKNRIIESLDQLTAGGSTAGGEGIELAYATARQNYIRGGNNRVILATDGDFNVGISDETGLERLIERKREEGVFLSVLGFGEGNLQDSKMELLADKGNGNYNYIDSEREAGKVLVSEFGGTLYTIAKDVKIQVEFNPARVESYRLVGYENRKLKNEDFENDRIDAGELGAGHTVTALYEVVPAGSSSSSNGSDGLKYSQRIFSMGATSSELLTIKLRYKDPDGSVSKLLTRALIDDGRNIAQTSEDFRWAAAAAEYAMILRQSAYKGLGNYEQVLALARSAMGRDKEGYRKEFVTLVERAMGLTQNASLDRGNR